MNFFSKALTATLLTIMLSTSSSFAQSAGQYNENPFVEKSLELLNLDDPISQNAVAKSLMNMGVTDARIYERLADLIKQYSASGDYKHLSWIAISLGASGDEQYKPLLENLAENGKRSKRHAKRALKELDTQQLVNAIAAKDNYIGQSKIAEKNDYIRNVLALLNSDDPQLHIKGAKQLVEMGIQEERIYRRAQELIDYYSTDSANKNSAALAWLVRGLAYSGNNTYRSSIENMPSEAKGKIKIKKHVKAALKILTKQETLNPILASEELYTGKETWKDIRDANIILFSDEHKRKKDIAEYAVVRNQHNPFLFESMQLLIASDFRETFDNKRKVDTYAYWMKAMAYFPTLESIKLTRELSKHAGNEKLRKFTTKLLSRNHHKFLKIEELKKTLDESNKLYTGEKFGSVNVAFTNEHNFGQEKVVSLEKMNLQAKVITMLQGTELYNEGSPNSLDIIITRYRVTNRASRAALGALIPFGGAATGPDLLASNVTLNLTNQPNTENALIPISVSKVYTNQYKGGEASLAKAYLRELNAALSYLR